MSAIMAGITALSFNSGLEGYQRQAEELLDAWRAGDTGALQIVHQRHPRFLDERIRWLPKKMSEAELRGGFVRPRRCPADGRPLVQLRGLATAGGICRSGYAEGV